jgi:hypothetical protein
MILFFTFFEEPVSLCRPLLLVILMLLVPLGIIGSVGQDEVLRRKQIDMYAICHH